MSLYLQHFGLRCDPFTITPNTEFLYPSAQHRQAIAHLKYGLDREGGFILLTGEVGTGKTTLSRILLKGIPAHVRVAYVLNGKLETRDILAGICHELDIQVVESPEISFAKQCIDALNRDLLQAHALGKKTLVVIEEAQNLSPDVLESLRLLSNLETNTHKLLHILLVGQPELLELLARKDLRQLNQRVVSRCHLQPLSRDDIPNYVNHRLHRAGASGAIFSSACMPEIYRITRGVPRLINLVCQHSLLAGYALGVSTITPKIVRGAAAEILGNQQTTSSPRRTLPLLLGSALATFVAAAVVLWWYGPVLRDKWVKPAVVEQVNDKQAEVRASPLPIVEKEVETNPLADAQGSEIEVESIQQLDPVAPPGIVFNPFASLLEIWGIQAGAIYTEEEFKLLAAQHGLVVEKVPDARWEQLRWINHPGIVVIRGENGEPSSQTLVRLDDRQVTLQSARGEIQISRESFTNAWAGSYLYLWKAPRGYDGVLYEGSVNPDVVDWLQNRLAKIDTGATPLITGGRYTAGVSEHVRRFQQRHGMTADGLLGRQTIMQIYRLSGEHLPWLSREDG